MNQSKGMSPNKFVTHGKTKLVNGSILMPELGNLRLLVVPSSETGKPDGELYTLLEKKWKSAKAEFKGWYAHHMDFKLGSVHTTAVQSDTWLLHCLCINKKGEVDTAALAACVKKVAAMAKYERGSVHVSTLVTDQMPEIMDLMNSEMIEKGISVYFYQEQE